MKSDILKRFVWTILFMLPFLVMWIVTAFFFKNEFLPMWHMHRYYLFVWLFVPVTVWLKKKALAAIISISYIGSILLALSIDVVVGSFSTPKSVVSGNSRSLFIWLITFGVLIGLSLIIKVFCDCRIKKRAKKAGELV